MSAEIDSADWKTAVLHLQFRKCAHVEGFTVQCVSLCVCVFFLGGGCHMLNLKGIYLSPSLQHKECNPSHSLDAS